MKCFLIEKNKDLSSSFNTKESFPYYDIQVHPVTSELKEKVQSYDLQKTSSGYDVYVKSSILTSFFWIDGGYVYTFEISKKNADIEDIDSFISSMESNSPILNNLHIEDPQYVYTTNDFIAHDNWREIDVKIVYLNEELTIKTDYPNFAIEQLDNSRSFERGKERALKDSNYKLVEEDAYSFVYKTDSSIETNFFVKWNDQNLKLVINNKEAEQKNMDAESFAKEVLNGIASLSEVEK